MTILLGRQSDMIRLSIRPPGLRDAQDPHEDIFHQRSMSSWAAWYDALSSRLRGRIRRNWWRRSLEYLFGIVDDTVLEFMHPFARLLTDSALATWIGGAGRVAEQLPAEPPPGFPAIPPPAPPRQDITMAGDWNWPGMNVWLPLVTTAIKDLQDRQLVTRPQFDQLEGQARAQAFTVAHQSSIEAIGTIRNAVLESVREGSGLRQFERRLDEALGESTLAPDHGETVLRTNVGQVYNDAAEAIARLPIVAPSFPYRQRLPIRDSRLTELCSTLARSGIQGTAIYRADDPFWEISRPLSHWRCRCSVRQLSVEDAAERGIKEAQKWLRTGRPPNVPTWVTPPDVQFPKGWNPGGRPFSNMVA